ncbi:MAG: 23S rRNA (uracil(1939)-C(5))-methyltransferase RlmD [Chitinophagaceae bacterium]
MKKKPFIIENVLVTDYAAEGRSLAKVEGKVIFIDGAVPGDLVDVRIRRNKKDWAEGKVHIFHSFSCERVPPFCEHFGVCGGCQWQMLPYEKQLKYKQQQVDDQLQRIGKIPLPPISPILGCHPHTHYRNKLEFTFSDRAYLTAEEITAHAGVIVERNALGFHIPGLFDKVLDITTCHLQKEPANLIKNCIRDYALDHQLPFFDLRLQEGWLRNLVLRICTTGEVMVNLVLYYEDHLSREKLLNHLLQRVPEITTLIYTINPKRNDSIHDLEPIIYFGKGFVQEKMENFIFNIGPKSFFQTNTYQGIALYQIIRKMAGLTGKEVVYDLYCGTGSIGIFVAARASRVIGIELIPEAIEDARQNATINSIDNIAFFSGDVIEVCGDEFIARHGQPDVVITDPPRAGMHEKLVRKLLEMCPPRLIYVSCNPASQARDLQMLAEKYEVKAVQPVDMFPHTHHIENVVLLVLKNQPSFPD